MGGGVKRRRGGEKEGALPASRDFEEGNRRLDWLVEVIVIRIAVFMPPTLPPTVERALLPPP